jgi:hypothetical protein
MLPTSIQSNYLVLKKLISKKYFKRLWEDYYPKKMIQEIEYICISLFQDICKLRIG